MAFLNYFRRAGRSGKRYLLTIPDHLPANAVAIMLWGDDWCREVLVLYLERPRATVRVRMRFVRALLIQRLEGSRLQGSLCTLNGAGRVRCVQELAVMGTIFRFDV